jgi:hypothetical protein
VRYLCARIQQRQEESGLDSAGLSLHVYNYSMFFRVCLYSFSFVWRWACFGHGLSSHRSSSLVN